MVKLVYLIPLFPFIGFLLNGLGRRVMSKSLIGIVGSGMVLASFVVSLLIFSEVRTEGFQQQVIHFFPFIQFDKISIPFAFQVDQLSALFLLIITGVGFLIHLYSTAYMHEEDTSNYGRYFSLVCANCFAVSALFKAAINTSIIQPPAMKPASLSH